LRIEACQRSRQRDTPLYLLVYVRLCPFRWLWWLSETVPTRIFARRLSSRSPLTWSAIRGFPAP